MTIHLGVKFCKDESVKVELKSRVMQKGEKLEVLLKIWQMEEKVEFGVCKNFA